MIRSSTRSHWPALMRIASAGPVALATLVLAAAFLVSTPPRVASAVFVTPPVFTAPIQAIGLTETWTIGGWQGSAPFHITSATVTFPAGFVIPLSPTVTVTAGGVACTVRRATVTGQSVAIEIVGSCETSAAPGVAPTRQSITIAGITNPATPATVAASGFKLSTSVDAEISAARGVVIWGVTASSLCYAPGDQSRAQVRFASTGNTAADNTGSGIANSLLFATTAGSFPQTPSLDSAFGTPSLIVPGVSTAIATVSATTAGGSFALVDVVMPSGTATATVTLRVIPAGGGTSVLLGSSDVTFAGGVCVPPAVAPPPAPPAAPVPAAGTFSGGTIAASGVSIVSFTGTTAQLDTAGAASKVVSVTATVGGKMLTFVVGAPDFVNTEFNAAFPTGLSGTLVIVKA